MFLELTVLVIDLKDQKIQIWITCGRVSIFLTQSMVVFLQSKTDKTVDTGPISRHLGGAASMCLVTTPNFTSRIAVGWVLWRHIRSSFRNKGENRKIKRKKISPHAAR